MSKTKLAGKTAVITGGARGIGKAITKKFLEEGAKVLICSRNLEELQKTAQELDQRGKNLFYTTADVSSLDSCKELFKKADELFQSLDILVNNAGIYGPIGLVETNSDQEWEKTIAINLMGTLYCTQAALTRMRKQKSGKIINLAGAGIGGKKPLERFSAYYTSKGAVAAFTEVTAAEASSDNVQVNCISPGAVNTFFTEYLLSQGKEKAGDMYNQATKQKESGGDSPELGANLVCFLAASTNPHLTGKILSAKWDKFEKLEKLTEVNKNLYTLRRIDEELFGENKN